VRAHADVRLKCNATHAMGTDIYFLSGAKKWSD
jgi:hypothetical protein